MSRWQELFADLDAYASTLANDDRAGLVGELARAEISATSLAERVRSGVSGLARVHTAAGVLDGRLVDVGPDWLLLETVDPWSSEAVVALSAITGIDGIAGRGTAAATDKVAARLGLASVLRRIARDRSAVRLLLTDGTELTGTLDRVAADFVETALHAADELRRAAAVTGMRVVPLTALVAVLRRH